MVLNKTEEFLADFPGEAETAITPEDLTFLDTPVADTGIRDIRKKNGDGFSPEEVAYMTSNEERVRTFFRLDGWFNTLCGYPSDDRPVKVGVVAVGHEGHFSGAVISSENWYPPSPC